MSELVNVVARPPILRAIYFDGSVESGEAVADFTSGEFLYEPSSGRRRINVPPFRHDQGGGYGCCYEGTWVVETPEGFRMYKEPDFRLKFKKTPKVQR